MTLPAAALCVFFCAGRARAVPRPIQPPAPNLPLEDIWLNAKGLSLKNLRGRRVAVVAFINTANLNSLRALAVLKAWDERYALDGLSVIAVHTPLYGFQKDPPQVERAIRRLGVTFPVVLDDDGALWKAYATEGWPAFYLVDTQGKIIYDLLGEGGYAEFESELRDALTQAGFSVEGERGAVDPPQEDCGAATPELALGSSARRPATFIDLEAQGDEAPPAVDDLVVSSRDGELGLRGVWRRDPEALRLAKADQEHSSYLRAICRGAQVFGLLSGPDGRESRFFVRQDGLWLHAGNAGPDVKFDAEGRSYVPAGEPRLYALVNNPNDSEHALSLMPADRGAAIHALQFADRCLPYKP